MTFKRMGLRSRVGMQILITVILSIYLVAAAGLVVTVVNYNKSNNKTIAAELKNCSNTMNSWLNEKSSVTEFMMEDIVEDRLLDNKAACLAYLKNCITRDDQVFDCYIGLADKSCIFGGGWEPAPGEYDPTVRDWYINAVNSDGVVITDPYTDSQTGRQVITFSIKLEIDGEVMGVLARDIFIDHISDIVNTLRIDEEGYAILMTADNRILVHVNEIYQPTVDASGNDVGTYFTDVMKDYPAEGTGSEVVPMTDYDGSKMYYSETIVSATGWKLGYSLDDGEYDHTLVAVSKLLSILSTIFAVIISIWVNICLKFAFKPLKKVAQTTRRVSEGLLTVKFDYDYDDEIGELCRTIESNNKVVSTYVSDIYARLDDLSHGRFDSVTTLDYIGDYAPIKRALNGIGGSLRNVFSGIDGASTAVFGGANGVANGANHLAESVSQQTMIISEVADEIDKVSSQIGMNVQRTDEARAVAKKTADVVKASNDQMTELLDAMKDIAKSSKEIKNIMSTIEEIASQTNILALNASVEAARAGAAGKGFAVVAEEVRNLAGASTNASKQTALLIERSTRAVNIGMKYADATSESLNKVVEQTGEIDDIIVKINEESHEQMTSMSSVKQKMGRVSDYVSSAAANAEESAAASQELNGQAASLREMLKGFGL